MKKFRLIKVFLLLILTLSLGGCFLLNKYIYTDKEITEHYKNKIIQPTYKKINFLNRSIHYATISKADTLPLLLLIHGAPGAWYGYLNLMDDGILQSKFKIISVDRLGYGKSNYGKAELSTQIQALAIKKIIEVENTSNKKTYLLGRSYGAPIAAWYAINYPQMVEKLLMVSPVIDPEHEKFYWFSNIGKWRITKLLLPKLLNVATEEKYAHQQEMKLLLPKWKRLFVKTYVIVGEKDNIADTTNFSFAKHKLINCSATFLKLKNTGHLVTREQPELIKKLLLESLQ
jgi:pimeloyl-ACP methyl ester carboxylesterase